MLETVNLKEELKVINGKAYAVINVLGKKRELNGCDVRRYVCYNLTELEALKKSLTDELAKINTEMAALTQIDSQLAAAGYCKKDSPVYKKIDGIAITDAKGNHIVIDTSHSETCKHKEG